MATGNSSSLDSAGHDRGGVLRGGHVLAMFLASFGIVLGVNAIFVIYAITTWSGLSVEQPYDRGIRYNQVLRVDRAELALGWSVQGNYDGRRIQATITDHTGLPIEGATVTAQLERPTNEGMDQEHLLSPAGKGRYEDSAAVPLSGQWDLRIVATRGADHVHWHTRVIVGQQGLVP